MRLGCWEAIVWVATMAPATPFLPMAMMMAGIRLIQKSRVSVRLQVRFLSENMSAGTRALHPVQLLWWEFRSCICLVAYICFVWYIPVSIRLGLLERTVLNLALDQFGHSFDKVQEVKRPNRQVIYSFGLSQAFMSRCLKRTLECWGLKGLGDWSINDGTDHSHSLDIRAWFRYQSLIAEESHSSVFH